MLELYEPGFRFRRSLETLVHEVARGRVAPDEVERFLVAPGVSLEAADAWLAGHLSKARQGVAGLLEQTGLAVVTEQLLGADTFLGARFDGEAACRALGRTPASADRHGRGLGAGWVSFCAAATGRRQLGG